MDEDRLDISTPVVSTSCFMYSSSPTYHHIKRRQVVQQKINNLRFKIANWIFPYGHIEDDW